MVNSPVKLEERLALDPFYQRNMPRKLEEPEYYAPITNLELYNPEENVFEANAYELGNNIGEGTTFGLTFTYSGRIILLDSLKGEDRKKVLEHEKHHRNNPDEYRLDAFENKIPYDWKK